MLSSPSVSVGRFGKVLDATAADGGLEWTGFDTATAGVDVTLGVVVEWGTVENGRVAGIGRSTNAGWSIGLSGGVLVWTKNGATDVTIGGFVPTASVPYAIIGTRVGSNFRLVVRNLQSGVVELNASAANNTAPVDHDGAAFIGTSVFGGPAVRIASVLISNGYAMADRDLLAWTLDPWGPVRMRSEMWARAVAATIVSKALTAPAEHTAAVTDALTAAAEHLTTVSQAETVSAEHAAAVTQLETIAAEHLLTEEFPWTLSAEHLAGLASAKTIPAEHLTPVSQAETGSAEHTSAVEQARTIPSEHDDADTAVSKSLTADAEHLAAITQLETIAAEHLAEVIDPLTAAAEHVVSLAVAKTIAAEHLTRIEVTEVGVSEHTAAVVVTLTAGAEHVLTAVVLFPVASKTGPATYDPMFTRAL